MSAGIQQRVGANAAGTPCQHPLRSSALLKADVRRRMRRVGVIVWMLALVAVAEADTVSVKGELSFNSNGIGKIAECDSGRIYKLGVMETNPYLRLVQSYWRISFHGKTPVMIKLRGGVTRTSNAETELTIQTPNIVTLVAGRCRDA